MAKSTSSDVLTLIRSLRSAYAATPTNLKIIDLYVVFAIATALIQQKPNIINKGKEGYMGNEKLA
ncbi:hypothetical protein M5K25_010481 [Dendrobium thyrsiflorum]|uniref:Dolichyl-diphosphooligosaccharide--protein glycosyltransferase subunit DAD1 n=1 Tax=Dendrobium thyrsiflorum TaxID=117978 RepID=A0ABD0V7E7_DENTH